MGHDVQWPLQQAIFAALAADPTLTSLVGTDGIHDDVDETATLPYVTIGDITQAPFATKTTEGMNATVTIHAWDDAHRGLRDIKLIMAAVLDVLHEAAFPVAGQTLVTSRFEFSDVFVEADGRTRHGVQRFRYLLCEVA